jgi:hypothetical protein
VSDRCIAGSNSRFYWWDELVFSMIVVEIAGALEEKRAGK